jgi:DNA-binding transcriptional regulator YhcF (GntR family)
MKQNPIFKYVHVDDFSATPKYYQIAHSIIAAISDGKIQQDDVLPSINELSFEFEISRDTAEKAYKHLKKLGILGSVPGKGYFIQNADLDQRYKILLLFNKLSEHKKIIYDSFASTLGEKAWIDFYIYNSDFSLFKKLINQKISDYTHIVILPHFRERWENVHEVINTIPKDRLILLDKKLPGVTGQYGSVFENFYMDIFGALESAAAQKRLGKYHTLKLVFPNDTYYPDEIKEGFLQFCSQHGFAHAVIPDIETADIQAGDLFINVRESDLVSLMDKINDQRWVVGQDVGIISYNETPLKKHLLHGGLTTISTDFKMMGEAAANMILNDEHKEVPIPFYLTLRDSI